MFDFKPAQYKKVFDLIKHLDGVRVYHSRGMICPKRTPGCNSYTVICRDTETVGKVAVLLQPVIAEVYGAPMCWAITTEENYPLTSIPDVWIWMNDPHTLQAERMLQ